MTCFPLAMHMANELLTPPVAAATLALAAGAVALSAARARRGLEADKLPLMGVMGAFVFAAQMINFTLPGMPGTSGHLGGGVLLAILLGPAAGIVTMAAILIVQCLLFQDGGLLALGCNIINMGVVPCLGGWALYKAILGRRPDAPAWRQYVAAWAACVAGVTAGAALVPVQAHVSGVSRIGLAEFLTVMVGVHLLIGLVEGAITFAVLGYLRRVRPAVLGIAAGQVQAGGGKPGRGAVFGTLAATALLLAGVVSWFASSHPDGLEWSYQDYAKDHLKVERPVENDSPVVAAVDAWQAKWSLMTDYTKRAAPLGQVPPEAEEGPAGQEEASWPNVDSWGSLAGVAGTAATLGLVYVAARLLRRRQAIATSQAG